MFRLFSIAVILNWVAVLAVLSILGLGLDIGSSGMIDLLHQALNGEAGLQLHSGTAHLLSSSAIFIVSTSALWALLAIIFAAPNGSENKQQDFVIMLAMGICLCVFALILALAIYTGSSILSANVCIASFATMLAGIAHRVFVIEAENRKAPHALSEGFGLYNVRPNDNFARAQNMTGSRRDRFVPKRNLQPMN